MIDSGSLIRAIKSIRVAIIYRFGSTSGSGLTLLIVVLVKDSYHQHLVQ